MYCAFALTPMYCRAIFRSSNTATPTNAEDTFPRPPVTDTPPIVQDQGQFYRNTGNLCCLWVSTDCIHIFSMTGHIEDEPSNSCYNQCDPYQIAKTKELTTTYVSILSGKATKRGCVCEQHVQTIYNLHGSQRCDERRYT